MSNNFDATAGRRGATFYYGWVIVGLAFISTGFWSASRTTFGVFLVALLDDFHWTRAGAAGVQSVSFITYTILAPVVGGLIDRFGPRRVILPGIILFSAGLFLSAFTHSLLQFYLFYGVITGAGVTFVSIVAYSAILSHWFERKRGMASGLAASGMGLGTFLLVPLMQYVIAAGGWRLAFMVLAALAFLLLFPVSAIFLRHKPQDLHLEPDGQKAGDPLPKRSVRIIDPAWTATDWTVRRLFAEPRFWSFLAFAFLIIIPVYMLVVHAPKFLVDRGIGKMNVAFMIGMVGVVSSGFRIFWGWLSDHIGREITATLGAICLALGALSLVWLQMSGNSKFAYLFVFLFGLGWGVTAPTFMSISADLFQGRRFGLIYGITEAVIGSGSAVGPWLAGFIFDRSHSYLPAFLVAAAAPLCSCLFVWLAAPRKVRRVV